MNATRLLQQSQMPIRLVVLWATTPKSARLGPKSVAPLAAATRQAWMLSRARIPFRFL